MTQCDTDGPRPVALMPSGGLAAGIKGEVRTLPNWRLQSIHSMLHPNHDHAPADRTPLVESSKPSGTVRTRAAGAGHIGPGPPAIDMKTLTPKQDTRGV